MKKVGMTAIGTIAVFACLLLCTPASANYNFDGFPVVTRTNGTVYGGVFIDSVAWTSATTLTGNFDVPDGDIKWARLYTGIWGGNPTNTGWVNVTFNGIYDENGLGPIHIQGKSDTNPNVWCSGCGKYWMWYNVTSLTNAGQTNIAKTWKINGSIDGRAYGIVLVVVYEGGDNPKDIQYWTNDGSDALHYFSWVCPECGEKKENTTYFNGTVNKDIVTKANLTMVHLTGYEPPCSNCLKFNGHELDTSMVDSNTFELNSWDVTDYVNASENNVWYSRGDDMFVNIANTILVLEREAVWKPDLTITAITPYHYEWSEEYDIPMGEPWFNLKSYVNVTVKNNGTAAARSFEVKLYADDELIGSEAVDELPADPPDNTTDVIFEWVPEGEDPLSWTDTAEGAICTYTDTSKTYTLRAVVDEANEVDEGENEENNELTKERKVVWNGYMADQPLENYVHDEVEGGIIYTTGDGQYRGCFTDGTVYGTYSDVNYDLEIPGSVKLTRLYIYHTWSKPEYTAPKIGVTLKTPSDDVHELSMEKSYNDIKSDFGPWRYVWGTYAYDITEYVGESGTYVVTVTNLNSGSDNDFAAEYAFAAPAILVVYEDTIAPKREYWINEGADILLGGRRGDGGFLSLEDCRNSATFGGEHLDLEIEKATLAVVSPWGEDVKNVLYFNDEELGEGVYCGYHDPCSSDEEIEGISMIIGASEAQVGIAAFDVTDDLEDYDNEVIQGDDGDNMMPVNAFLVITYEEDEEPTTAFDTGSPANPYPSIFGTHNGTITVNQNITVNKMYTYPCSGTGGHTEFVKIWNETTGDCAEAHWDGYTGDYHNISFNKTLILKKGVIYNYTIRTGSYPQIQHTETGELEVDGGTITCTKFTDANGKTYNNWIPAIKLFLW